MKVYTNVINYARSPSMEGGALSWTQGGSGTNGSFAVSTDWADTGTQSLKYVQADNTAQKRALTYMLTEDVPLMRGKKVTMSATLNLPQAITRVDDRTPRLICVLGRSGIYTSLYGPKPTLSAGVQKLSFTFEIPDDPNIDLIEFSLGLTANTGNVIYWDSVMLTLTDSPVTYKDPSFAGWSWLGTANNSKSQGPVYLTKPLRAPTQVMNMATNPSMEVGSTTIQVRRNLCVDPRATSAVSASGANIGWRQQWYGDTGYAGSTSLQTGDTPFGAGTFVRKTWTSVIPQSTGNFSFQFTERVGPGSTLLYPCLSEQAYAVSFWLRASFPVTGTVQAIISDASGTQLSIQTSSPQTLTLNEWTRVTYTFVTPLNAAFMSLRHAASAGNPTLGGTLDGTGLMVEAHRVILPYFDGTFNEWQSPDLTPAWTGTANASQSVLNGIIPAGVTGVSSSTTNKVWLSSDRPYGGTKFARAFVLRDDNAASYFYLNDYNRFGEGKTATHSTMIRVSRTITGIDVRYPGGAPMSAPISTWGSTVSPPVDVWREARVTGVEAADGQRWVRPWTYSGGNARWLGDYLFVDMDQHFAIAGAYGGTYFDGSTAGATWSGTANASTSYKDGYKEFPLKYATGPLTNWIRNPKMIGSANFAQGTVAQQFAPYLSGGLGNLTALLPYQNITATTLNTGNRRFGMTIGGVNMGAVVPGGSKTFTIVANVDLSALDPGTRFKIEVNTSNSGVYQWAGAGSYASSAITRAEYTFTPPTDFTSMSIYFYIEGIAVWSGTSTAIVKETWAIDSAEVLPYRDGSSTNWSWSGAADASTSSGLIFKNTK